jgi:hypothetical protein
VDFNQELCDPVEKEFSSDWQRIMDSSIRVYLVECETQVLALCSSVDNALASAFTEAGLSSDRLSLMVNAASRSCKTALKAAFRAMKEAATSSQRDLNRSLLPAVQTRMKDSYNATLSVPSGTGKFMRMKNAMESITLGSLGSLFDDSTKELLAAVGNLILQLSGIIEGTVQVIRKTLESVYSVIWDDQSDTSALIDPVQQQKIRACRDRVLPHLNRLFDVQGSAMELLGLEREELELDVIGVDTVDTRIARKLQEAMDKGEVIGLCDLDSDDNSIANTKSAASSMPAVVSTLKKVKAEPLDDLATPTSHWSPFPRNSAVTPRDDYGFL